MLVDPPKTVMYEDLNIGMKDISAIRATLNQRRFQQAAAHPAVSIGSGAIA